jgi:hypothetical protein
MGLTLKIGAFYIALLASKFLVSVNSSQEALKNPPLHNVHVTDGF